MDLASLTPERLVSLLVFEFTHTDVDWWSWALDLLGQARKELPVRYEKYRFFLGRYLPEDSRSITGFALAGLTAPQKALQLFVLDTFADNMIMTHDTFEDWLGGWDQHIPPFAVAAYQAMLARPALIESRELQAAWAMLRAAIS